MRSILLPIDGRRQGLRGVGGEGARVSPLDGHGKEAPGEGGRATGAGEGGTIDCFFRVKRYV